MYTKVILISYILLVISCKNKQTIKKEVINHSTSEENINNERKSINHLTVTNGGSILYMKNGERRSQARFDTDGDFVTELLKVAVKDGNYMNFENYLIDSNDTISFFNYNGEIKSDWQILQGVNVKSKLQVVSYTSPKNKNLNNIEYIKKTELIIFGSKINKSNPDAFLFFAKKIEKYFLNKGITSLFTKKRYLEFEIDNKNIILDTRRKMNNYSPNCLLYKKGKNPIIIHLVLEDNNIDEINYYLN